MGAAPTGGGPERSAPSASMPRTLRVAVLLTALTGIGLLGYGVFLTVGWLSEPPDQPLGAAVLVLIAVAWGTGMLVCARGLSQRHRWALAPVVTSALILGAVGWLLAGGPGAEVPVGWAVVAVAAGSLVSVLLAARHVG